MIHYYTFVCLDIYYTEYGNYIKYFLIRPYGLCVDK
nr:MAG TPA: hypothetical protein [Bacteriophage sp.]